MDFLDIKATWKDLKAVITDPNLCLVFRGFLKEILGGENLSFVVEVQGYKEILSPDLRKIRAKEIWDKYCTPLSSYEINIEAYARESVKTKLDDAPQLLFQELEDAVTQILLQDSFPKFLGSEQFKQYVEHTRKEEAAKQNLEIVATSSKKPNKKDKDKTGKDGAKKLDAKAQLIPSTAPVRHHHGSIVMYTNYLADKLTIQESKELQKIIDKLQVFTEKQATTIDMTNTKDMNTFFKSGNQFGQLWPTSMQRLILKNCGLDSFPNLEGLSEKQLIELNLSRNRIPSVPLMLTNLGSVTSLNLSENLLTALPAQISQLGQLKELNLERNLLSSLPTQISELTNLEILTLPFNLLTEFPKELYKLENLQLLLLDSNKIKSISDEISQMTSLRFLSMVELPDIEIPPAIVHCKNLKELVHTPSQTFVVPANISEYGNEIVVRYFYLLRSLKVTNLQFKSHWKPDILFKSCKVCGAAFNYVNRRHHCRLCGLIVDSKCLIATKKPQPRLGFDKPIKICTACQACLTNLEQELIAKSEQGEFDINSTPPPTQRQLILQAQNSSRESSNSNTPSTSASTSNASSTNNSNNNSPRIVPMPGDPTLALRDALGNIARDIVTRQTAPNQVKQNSTPNLFREAEKSGPLLITRNRSQQLSPDKGTLQTSLSAPAVNTISFEVTSSPPNNPTMGSPGTSPSNRVIFRSTTSSPRPVTAPTSNNSSIEVETNVSTSNNNESGSGAKNWRVIMPTTPIVTQNTQTSNSNTSNGEKTNNEATMRRSDSPTVYNYILEKGIPNANNSYK